MNIQKQIVDQRVRKIIEENPDLEILTNDSEKKLSMAFLLLGVAVYLDRDIADIVCHITEGGDDGGFDAAVLDIVEDTLRVTFFQAKYTRDLNKDSSFPANAVEKAVLAVKSIFDHGSRMALNENSRRVVNQIRSYTADGYIPDVCFVFASNGPIWNQDGQNKIDNEFKGMAQIKFRHFNHIDIYDAISRRDSINTQIRFSGKAVGEQLMYKPVVIGRVSVAEIARLLVEHGDALFERNVRKYLGTSINSVNIDIRETLLKDSGNFFFFNNGITMVCRNLRYNELQKEDCIVQAEDLQIINGGQTCRTIQETADGNPDIDYSDTYVLVRIYAIGDDEQVAIGITKATNTQNPIDLRDLRANEPEQRMLEVGARELGFVYKRKRDAVLNIIADTITSSVAAEAVYTVWRGKPHLVSRKKNELFGSDYYTDVFRDLNAAQMIIAVLAHRYCDNIRRRKTSADRKLTAHRAFSQYLLAAIIGKQLLAECGLTLDKLDHNSFEMVRNQFDQSKERLYDEAEQKLVAQLKQEFGEDYHLADGRSIAAVFRRFEFVEKVLVESA